MRTKGLDKCRWNEGEEARPDGHHARAGACYSAGILLAAYAGGGLRAPLRRYVAQGYELEDSVPPHAFPK